MTETHPVWPHLSGRLVSDSETLARAATDFGHVVNERPQAILRPRSADDISVALRYAANHSIPVAARGRGHSSYGQAQVANGLVVEMDQFADIQHVSDDHIVVDAGATWLDVLQASLRLNRTPPVLTDYLGISVGGTLSIGGIGGTSHRYGVQTDNVLSLEVVTGNSVVRTCSSTESPDLFHAVLAGLGQCAIITRATLRLAPAPARVRRYRLYYSTATELLTHQRRLLHENRFDFLQGQILPGETGWIYMLDAATYYSQPHQPDDQISLTGLGYDSSRDQVDDLSYLDFANRLADAATFLEKTGEWHHPHPWSNLFLADSATDPFVEGILADLQPTDLGAPGLLLIYPILTQPLTTPLFRVPDDPVVFLLAALRFAPPGDPAATLKMITENRQWYDTARQTGGTVYPSGAIPFSRDDWHRHYGPARTDLIAAKQNYDPSGVLQPGLIRE